METVHAEILRRMVDRFRITVIACDLDSDLRDRVHWERIRVPSRPIPLKIVLFAIKAGLRLRTLDYDLVHTCGAVIPNRVDTISVHFCHTGYVRHFRSLAPKDVRGSLYRANTAIKRLLALAMEYWSYRPQRCRVLMAVSEQIRQELNLAFPRTPVHLTYNGADATRFAPNNDVRQMMRKQHDVDEDDLVALFIGGDWARKGLALAFSGVATARRMGAPLTLWVVGDGPHTQYARLARELGIGSSVKFMGHRTDTAPWYQAADIYLCTSEYESFSLALVEAIATGLPVVTTRVGVAEDLFKGAAASKGAAVGSPGRLVPLDSDAVGEALFWLAGDRTLRRQCGTAARARSLTFSWERLAAEVAGIYNSLLDAPAGPSG